MGTIAEKLTYLNNTKSDIRDAIIAKGVDVPTETTFRDYATKIEDIKDAETTLEFVERVNDEGGTVTNLNNVLEELNNVTDESLLMIPSGRKEGVLYSQLPTNGSGDFTVNRNSPVWIENSEGVLVEVPANVPVFDKNGNLVVQGQSTNLVTYSEDFTDSSWIERGITITNNATIAPNLELSGCDFKNNEDFANLQSNIILNKNGLYSISVFAKKSSSNVLIIRSYNYDNSVRTHFILEGAGSIEYEDSLKSNIKHIGNGWYKCEHIFEATYTLNGFVRFQASNDVDFLARTDDSVYIWGPQLEEGTEPSTYIPTNGAAETRLADEITVTPPTGTTEIIETINGVENTITTIPVTYQISEGLISKIVMK